MRTPEELLDELGSQQAIERLVMTYAKGRDTTEPDLYRAVFAADAVIASGSGHVLSGDLEEILAKVAGDQERFNAGYRPGEVSWSSMRHLVGNLLIELDLDSETAIGEYYVTTLAHHPDKKRPEVIATARNEDRFARRDGRWWIVRSTLHFGWESEEMGRLLQVGPWTPAAYRH